MQSDHSKSEKMHGHRRGQFQTIACPICKDSAQHSRQANDLVPVQAIIRAHADQFFEYYRCKECESLVLNAEPDLPAYYAIYPLQNHELNHHTRMAYEKRLRRLQQHGVNPDWHILDYGCGRGLFVQFLKERGFKNVQGYDPYIAEMRDPRALEQRYDLVCCQDVIEHVTDPGECARLLASLTRENGMIEIGTPRADGIDLKREESYRFEISAPYHLQVFSEQALVELLGTAGLKTIARYRTFYFDVARPFLNLRFVKAYFKACGSVLECFFEKPKASTALRPSVLLNGLFGWLKQPTTNMTLLLVPRGVL